MLETTELVLEKRRSRKIGEWEGELERTGLGRRTLKADGSNRTRLRSADSDMKYIRDYILWCAVPRRFWRGAASYNFY
jgi:hypothetical protein